ncbi:MAG: hypothetical protein HY673_02190 [Chloroflexi bacterium]|nr:hypothetical protein [Chloroflexota bacterium]
MNTKNVALLSAILYTGISLLVAGLFFAVTLAGSYSWVARIGGAAWVFLLSMIVLMPVIIPLVKKRMRA